MVESLVRGICPVCGKIIMNKEKTSYINGGMSFWVKFSDDSKAEFAICQDCYSVVTQEQLDEIMRRQIVSWGEEIQAQMRWFAKIAVHLRIIKWSKDKIL